MEVSDLKLAILQQLLAHPMLAREFNQDVIDEHLHGDDRIDREIAEVWRASTATTASEAAVLSQGALLEMLGDSEYADQYRAIAAQEMEIETGVDVARQIVSEAYCQAEAASLRARSGGAAGRLRARSVAAAAGRLPGGGSGVHAGPRAGRAATGGALAAGPELKLRRQLNFLPQNWPNRGKFNGCRQLRPRCRQMSSSAQEIANDRWRE